MKRVLVGILLLLCLTPQYVGAENVIISPSVPQPGDAVFVTVPGSIAVTSSSFNGQPAYPFAYRDTSRLVFPVPINQKPGTYPLSITLANGEKIERLITIKKRTFPKVVLGIPEKLDLTPQTLGEKLADEKKNLANTLTSSSPNVYFKNTFGLSLYNNRRLGSPFGEIRQTGNTTVRHLGVDFTAPEGKPVAAINSGVVAQAYLDTIYGNSVIIDHGAHIFSMYLHLASMKVKSGEPVTQGQVIGTVGETGYATTPHLHLSIKIGETSVDPLHFVRDFK